MANSRPSPLDPVNGGWADAALSRPHSPPPAYSSPPPEPVDIAPGTMNTLSDIWFGNATDEESDWGVEDEEIVLVQISRLKEQLRRNGAPVVQPAPQPVPLVPEQPFPFMKLPLELREQVYDEYFRASGRLETHECADGLSGMYEFEFALLRTSKQIYLEALRSWRKNVFVRVETPWPHAVYHIRSDGQVPIVASGPRADAFTQYTALVQITAPLHGVTVPEHTIILVLADLPKFTRVWYYSALNYTNLNPQVCLTFTLRDPYYPADPKPIPLALQRELLLPFGDVKGLWGTEFEGYDETAISELRRSMAIPYPTVQESCETATTLMEEGDLLLATNKPQNALDAYIKSFDAIHIKISGRMRKVLADGHFADDISRGRYAGQAAMTVRVVLRIRLVARVIHTYLHLQRPDEAAFWGIRSIKLMRQGTNPDNDMEDFFSEFIGSSDMACIYAWTAAALMIMEKEVGKWADEREEYIWEDEHVTNCDFLWRRAGLYLAPSKHTAERKRIVEEVKRFGIRAPAGVFSEEADEVDSMSHLNLEAVEH